MGKMILKPLDIFETDSLNLIIRHFNESKKLYILAGAEKVGKTAFSLKLLRGLLEEDMHPLLIWLDCSSYWQDRLKQDFDQTAFRYPFKQKAPSSLQDITRVLREELLRKQNSFVIIDGTDKYRNVLSKHDFDTLLIFLVNFTKIWKVNIFIPTRTNQLPLLHPYLINAQQDGGIELWHLERPEYLGGEIREFGRRG